MALAWIIRLYLLRVAKRAEPVIDGHLDAAAGRMKRLAAKLSGRKTIAAPPPAAVPDAAPPKPRSGNPAYADPASLKPDYREDVFLDVRWRWNWGYSTPFEWHPCELEPYCVDPECDMQMVVRDSSRIGRDAGATWFFCQAQRCRPRVVARPYRGVLDYVAANIESNWRNNRRGERAPSPPANAGD